MFNLLQIEFKKIIPYKTFWVIFGLVLILTPIVFYGVGQINIQGLPIDFTTLYKFPHVWNNITYVASWFNLLIGMCIVILVCNEFSFKTFRQHVIDGQDKSDFIISKILLMTTFALVSTIYLFFVGSCFGFLSTGSNSDYFLTDISYLVIYFVQALGYMSVALILAVLIRQTALSIIAFIFSIVIENIIQAFIPHPIDKYFPMEIISNLTPFPFPEGMVADEMKKAVFQDQIPLNTTVIVAIMYVFIFWGISYWILTKKDIK